MMDIFEAGEFLRNIHSHIQGAYSSTKTYKKYDIVTQDGLKYVSLINGNKNHSPSSSLEYWQPLEVIGKVGFVVRGTYKAANTYSKLDIVTYNGLRYVSIVDNNTGHTPTGNTNEYWQLLASNGIYTPTVVNKILQ